ncbi:MULTISPECIES: serine hydrolase [unclassified Brevundimonas]|uniref:serine hydrolase domain-containing protein n=1 Tax=unclassified Brevundimonas TaxID=2622653 RepID=UPI000700AFB2|nr:MULTISPECIES: serine hydrolase domain-containing protein [unclassified Brevundimonas]KQY95018.1 hypothetical protein ASD25_17005 [Brevundimonas sp. Root1423]KRA28504.1 hypothetical protein ASD59_01345 [Brevundimonas sp. Root608]
MKPPHATWAVQPDRRQWMNGAAAMLMIGAVKPGAVSAATRDAALTFEHCQAVVDGYVTARRLPGATVGLRHGTSGPAYVRAGALAFDDPTPVDDRTIFRIYSLTKLITGAACALLIEDGRLHLDQPVVEIIPEFRALKVAVNPGEGLEGTALERPMTIRHLLTHTSGLTYHFSGAGPVHMAYRRAGIFPSTGATIDPRPAIDGPKAADLEQMVARLADIPRLFQPGTAYEYGVSLDVLGLVIQRVSGMSFEAFVRTRLLDPIGMPDTDWRLPADKADRFASFYAFTASGPIRIDSPATTAYAQPVTLFAGGAGLLSSTRDYLRFLTMLLDEGRVGDRRVMRPETARLIHTNILPEAVTGFDGQGHGFGGYVRLRDDPAPGGLRAGSYGHYGAAGTTAWIDPESGLAAVVMVQQFPTDHTPIVNDVRRAIAEDLGSTSPARASVGG